MIRMMRQAIVKIVVLVIACGITACASMRYDDGWVEDVTPYIEDRPLTPYSTMPSEPGKCYAKCLIADVLNHSYRTYYKYIGTAEYYPEGVISYEHQSLPPTTKWVKKKANKNCLSRNPEECMVWCLVETPGKVEFVEEVIDTSLCKDFVLDTLKKRQIVAAGGYTGWKEVVCSQDITKSLIIDIQEKLIVKGFLTAQATSGEMDSITKNAIVKLQKQENLPISQLDIETLEFLDLDWDQ